MIAVISAVHFPSNAERQKIMETGLKKLTGIRALLFAAISQIIARTQSQKRR